MKDVPLSNLLQARHDIVVRRIAERSEEVLQDLKEEQDLAETQYVAHLLVNVGVGAEGHNVEVKEDVRDDNYADYDLENEYELALSVQDEPRETRERMRKSISKTRFERHAHRGENLKIQTNYLPVWLLRLVLLNINVARICRGNDRSVSVLTPLNLALAGRARLSVIHALILQVVESCGRSQRLCINSRRALTEDYTLLAVDLLEVSLFFFIGEGAT